MKLKNVLIVVEDIEKSREFYKDLFGMDVVADLGGNIVLTGGLVLQDKGIWQTAIDKEIQYKGHNTVLYFEERDLGAFMEKLTKYKVSIEYLTPCTWLPHGQRMLRIYDLDGHIIEVREAALG